MRHRAQYAGVSTVTRLVRQAGAMSLTLSMVSGSSFQARGSDNLDSINPNPWPAVKHCPTIATRKAGEPKPTPLYSNLHKQFSIS
jgi:hypothetical protein